MYNVADLHWRHDLLDLFVVQLKDAVEYTDFIVAKGFLALTVKSKERTKFCFLVCVSLVMTQNAIKQFGNRPSDGRCGKSTRGKKKKKEQGGRPKKYIIANTTGAQDAPTERP